MPAKKTAKKTTRTIRPKIIKPVKTDDVKAKESVEDSVLMVANAID